MEERNPDIRRALFTHAALVRRYGGAQGLRDQGTLEAALERSWQASFGGEHFPEPHEKAAALCEAIIRRHPFIDGNKRTGVTLGAYLLWTFGYRLVASQKELEDFGVAVATGKLEQESIAAWFGEHSAPN